MKLKKIRNFLFLAVAVFFTSCTQKEYYVAVQSDLYLKLPEKTVYQDKKMLVKAMPESYKTNENTVTEIYCYKEYSPLMEKYFNSREKNGGQTAAENSENQENTWEIKLSEKKSEMLLEKNLYYPCMQFSEDMPLTADNNLLFEDSNQDQNTPDFYKLNEIPEGFIALPYTDQAPSKAVEEKIKLCDLRALDAVYPDNPEYPFYENIISVCKSNIPAEKENKAFWKKISDITFNWYKDCFYRQFYRAEKVPSVFFSACTGDIMIARGVEDILIKDNKPDAVFNDTLKVLQHNDFTMGNLEGVVTDKWDAAIKTYTFKFKKKALPQLKAAGFDYFMITNNHSYDYGEAGFKDTLSALNEYDFKYSGAGYNLDEAQKMYTTTINGTKVSVLSVGAYPVEQSGFNGAVTASAKADRAGVLWKSQAVYDAVKAAKKNGDFVIINSHAGNEYVKEPSAVQKEFYKNLCDCGADVIFGSHPHILQRIEWYNKSLIVYSLGNFVFPGMGEMEGAEDSMIVRIGVVNGRLLYYQKFPAKLNDKTVDLK